MHKCLRKRRPEENVWNTECAWKFSIVTCKQLTCKGSARVCTRVQSLRSRRGSLHTQPVAGLSSRSLILLASTWLQQAGSLKREGWHRWHLISARASAANNFSHSITHVASVRHLGSMGCEYSSALADFSAERPCKLKGPPGRIDGSYLLCHNFWDNSGKVNALTLSRLQHNHFQCTFLSYCVATYILCGLELNIQFKNVSSWQFPQRKKEGELTAKKKLCPLERFVCWILAVDLNCLQGKLMALRVWSQFS